jgi:hypothetical protein
VAGVVAGAVPEGGVVPVAAGAGVVTVCVTVSAGCVPVCAGVVDVWVWVVVVDVVPLLDLLFLLPEKSVVPWPGRPIEPPAMTSGTV